MKLLLCLPLRGSGVLRRKGPRANVEGSRRLGVQTMRHGHPAARPDLLVHYCAGLLKYAICHVQRCMCTFRRLRQGQGITASKHECRGRCCFGCGLGLGFLSSLNCFQPAAAARHRRHFAKRSRGFTPQSGRYVVASNGSMACCRHVRKSWTLLRGDAWNLLKQAPTHATAFPRLPGSGFLTEAVQPKHPDPACCF